MKIIILDEVDSTHRYLKDYIKDNTYTEPICILTDLQTNGVGSRGNSWTGKRGNLFFSFVLDKSLLPHDLPLQSASIYFSFLLKKALEDLGSKLWLKWPNDFYINNKKIGGTITNMSGNLIYCGIGLNLLSVNSDFGNLDIEVDKNQLLDNYFSYLSKKFLWKQIFSEFKIEFQYSRKYQATIDGVKVPLSGASLNNDGSIQVKDKKVFSLR